MDNRSPSGPDAGGVAGAAVLIYDGSCGLCESSVRFVLGRDRRHTLRFATLESDFGRRVRRQHPELSTVDSMVWVEPSRVFVRSDAALQVARYLGGIWRLATVLRFLPRPIRDRAYDIVARHRHRWTGAPECWTPPPDERSRFLD